MGDLVLDQFRGILSGIEKRDIAKNQFADGQNFVAYNGRLKKRNGSTKQHTARLSGAVIGIAFVRGRDRDVINRPNAGLPVDGELIIAAGSRFYSGKW